MARELKAKENEINDKLKQLALKPFELEIEESKLDELISEAIKEENDISQSEMHSEYSYNEDIKKSTKKVNIVSPEELQRQINDAKIMVENFKKDNETHNNILSKVADDH